MLVKDQTVKKVQSQQFKEAKANPLWKANRMAKKISNNIKAVSQQKQKGFGQENKNSHNPVSSYSTSRGYHAFAVIPQLRYIFIQPERGCSSHVTLWSEAVRESRMMRNTSN